MVGALFSGQGSQHIGMGDFLIEAFPRAKYLFDEASEVLGFNLTEMVLEGDEETLALTENTQPALLTLSFAKYRVLKDMGEMKVAVGAGHSVGEYAALVAAGALDFKDAVSLTRLRGRYMQEAVPEGLGGMLAVMGLDPDEVDKLCAWAKEKNPDLGVIEPANYNSPAQTVISGDSRILRWAQKNFTPSDIDSTKTKVKLIPLKVSAPFHCSMMKSAELNMRDHIEKANFHVPQYGVIQNYTGKYVVDPDELKENLIRQISCPVRWVDCIRTMAEMEVDTVAEFGPGKVLTGLLKKIESEAILGFNLNSIAELKTYDHHLERLNEQAAQEAKRKKILEDEAQ